jgi:hypothetical protein
MVVILAGPGKGGGGGGGAVAKTEFSLPVDTKHK